MIRPAVPERVAIKISWHRTRTVFDRYDIINEEDLRNASESLHNHHESNSERVAQTHDGNNRSS
jgi:hypothetical protein|tara:strand:- start:298 stop:489 length:192 start_codon:yes stop_codon:yes gene_type:complete